MEKQTSFITKEVYTLGKSRVKIRYIYLRGAAQTYGKAKDGRSGLRNFRRK